MSGGGRARWRADRRRDVRCPAADEVHFLLGNQGADGRSDLALIAEAAVDFSRTVASYLPPFGENGKGAVTVEQVMLHTGGFPMAPLGPREWGTHESRLAAYAGWRLESTPGDRYVYHPTSGQWVLSDIIEVVAGEPYCDAIHRLVTEPLGLPRLLGIPLAEQADIAEVVGVGEPATVDELVAAFGERVRDAPRLPADLVVWALTSLNHPKAKAQGVPGGGGVVWDACFSAAFGHNGAGVQLAFADPATGLSCAYLTSGLDQNVAREYFRNVEIADAMSAVAVAND